MKKTAKHKYVATITMEISAKSKKVLDETVALYKKLAAGKAIILPSDM